MAADVRLHTRQGYPSFGAAEQKELALHAFLQALTPERLRQHVILATPRSLDEALKEAESAEDVLCLAPGQTARPREVDCYEEEEVRWARSPPQQRRQRPPPVRHGCCYRCDEPGHLACVCPAPAPKPQSPWPSGSNTGTAL
ncbi:hypothetical protein AAFF_G00073660 [Aldrovandia affinis]|uniref:CCHC-type domain-containing protein n=1 Tax=Aldrovandia affinis TaxID=143900 RepID=A0AAD7RYS8_9TELE|nr:hypothetical protein AAFF_G00073660 [Aldrovandia affinis]